MKQTTFDIDGLIVVLHYVRNIYPVDEDARGVGYEWGFKYTDGSWEFFVYKTKKEAKKIWSAFVKAVQSYWEESKNEDR